MRYDAYRNARGTLVVVQIPDTPFPEDDPRYDLCLCPYTGALFERRDGIVLGSVIPQVASSQLCHPLAAEARRRSVVLFNEHERNCNTCRHLVRAQHPRDPFGFLYGSCKEGDRMFHPDDWMGMFCYESRGTKP